MRSPAVATIAMVKPDRLAPQGGTPVAVHYGPVGVDFGPVIGVRIGGLFASNVLAGAKDVVDSATGDVWNVVNAVAPHRVQRVIACHRQRLPAQARSARAASASAGQRPRQQSAVAHCH